MAAAHAGVNPRWLFHDGFPDPLFAVADGQGSSQVQELALGADSVMLGGTKRVMSW